MADKMKVIIDMDIGDDIDDAIALYAAMRCKLDIIGITTVFRNTAERARQAKKLLKEYANGYENVPVFAGHGTPLGTENEQPWPHIPHYTAELEKSIYAPDGSTPDDAVDFIIESCRKYGSELTVVAIGPFTNIARVIEKDADALNMAARVVIMGGAYYKQYADWNVICDVTAADIMFKSLNNLECIGADVTHLTVAEDDMYDDLLNYAGRENGHIYLTELCNLWRKDRPKAELVLHDPLVIYYLVNSVIFSMKYASVVVMTEGYARGLTLNVDAYGKKNLNSDAYVGFDSERKVLVASAIDLGAFNSRIFNDFKA